MSREFCWYFDKTVLKWSWIKYNTFAYTEKNKRQILIEFSKGEQTIISFNYFCKTQSRNLKNVANVFKFYSVSILAIRGQRHLLTL